jgi:predicted transcriptional regulator
MSVNHTVSPIMADFCDKLRERMDAKGLTPSELAAKAGVGMPYLYRVLKGEHVPTVDWMQKVGKHVGISVRLVVK